MSVLQNLQIFPRIIFSFVQKKNNSNKSNIINSSSSVVTIVQEQSIKW